MEVVYGGVRETVSVAEPTSVLEEAGRLTSDQGVNVSSNTTMQTSFIYSPYAISISGVLVWSALFFTCFQVGRL